MSEVIRLIRIGLVLRIGVSALAAAGAALVLGSRSLALEMALALPSLAVLGTAFAALGRGWSSSRFVKGLLVAVIVAQTAEAVLGKLAFHFLVPSESLGSIGGELQKALGQAPAAETMPPRLVAPVLFIAVAAILGAWVSSRGCRSNWPPRASGCAWRATCTTRWRTPWPG